MVSVTTNLSLNKPAVNSATDEDLWGAQLNTNMDTLDSEAVLATVAKSYADLVMSRMKVEDFSETVHVDGSVTGALTIDYTDGHVQTMTLTGNITSLTINNFPTTGDGGWMTLIMTQDGTGTRTIDLSSGGYRSPGGIAPVLSTGGGAIDQLYITSIDAGTTKDVTLNLNYLDIT